MQSMEYKIKKIIPTEYITAILSVFLFLLFYGWRCLDVTNTDWLMVGGDLSQHYLGWKFYRFASWELPIGMMDTIAYPFKESILFTDSIPIFAVLFKLLSPILPKSFQYFGLWGLMCFILQGVIGCNILKKYFASPVSQAAGGLLFVLTPCMIRRMFWHTSLGGQWILLLCLWCIVYQTERFQKLWKSIVVWAVIGVLSVSIHIYFVPMCGIFLLGFLILDGVIYKKISRVLWILAGFFAAVLFSTWLFGGFASGMESGAPGLAYYSFNLNGFINPQEWDCILPRWSNYVDGQFEGFSYLGLGMILLIAVTTGMWIYQIASGEKVWNRKKGIAALTALGMLLLSVFSATSNEIAIGTKLLLKFPIPDIAEKIWSIFRSTGRMVWPAVYLWMFYGMISGTGCRNKRYWKYLLCFCMALQLVDITGAARLQAEPVRERETYQTRLTDDIWTEITEKRQITHVVMMDKDFMSQEQLYAVSDFASDKRITINDFYFARALNSPIEKVAEDFAEHPQEDCIYLFTTKSFFECGHYPLSFYQANGFLIGLKTPLEGRKAADPNQYSTYHMDFEGSNLIQGEDREKVRYLYEGGVSYGPFLHLEPGEYQVMIVGSNLEEAEVSTYSDGGASVFPFHTETWEENRIEFTFSLEESVDDWEVNVQNRGKELMITDIRVERRQ